MARHVCSRDRDRGMHIGFDDCAKSIGVFAV